MRDSQSAPSSSDGEFEGLPPDPVFEKTPPVRLPKPCPFCEGTDIDIVSEEAGHFIQCNECQAMGPFCDSTDSAMDTWDSINP